MESKFKQICPPEGGRYRSNFKTNDKGCRAKGRGATFKPKALKATATNAAR
jgi:hypothetical protein